MTAVPVLGAGGAVAPAVLGTGGAVAAGVLRTSFHVHPHTVSEVS